MSHTSLLALTRQQSLKWTGYVTGLAVITCSFLIGLLFLKDAEREVRVMGQTIISSYRSDILGGNIRTVEVQITDQLKKDDGDEFVFLDTNKSPWISNPNTSLNESCADSGTLCRSFEKKKLIVDFPIYFDSERTQLWGYLHIERTPNIHWEIILIVAITLFAGMLSLASLLQYQFMKLINVVSNTMKDWGDHLRLDPKNSQKFKEAPYSELESIAQSLRGLNKEISDLESSAHKRGSLNTLRSIGHDILNPVARMKRIIGVMKLQPNYSENDFVFNLESNLKRLSGYAEQIKSLYKRETGDPHMANMTATDLSLEIQNLARDLLNDQDFVTKGLRLELSLQPNCMVTIPSSVLSRIAENLMLNSFHASKSHASVKVSTAETDGMVTLRVEDSGLGIPATICDKIFDANFTTKTNKGTGLGLFVVKQLCEQHAGKIDFHSTEGTGSTFEVSFMKPGVSP